MNAATQFDAGPLTWVKGEIDLALARADEALAQFAVGGDATRLKFCRTHLHQVRGALAMVGLDGLTCFADALEGLLEDCEQRPAAADGMSLAAEALAAIRRHLDGLIDGEADQPLRLLPLYGRLRAARGAQCVSASDLFFPDLSLGPPRRPAPQPLPPGESQARLRAQRSRFQHGLLAWLHHPGEAAGAAEMLAVARQLEATQVPAAGRAFWWAASGMLAALAEGGLPADDDLRQLCVRIEQQIRRLPDGSESVAERLLRDVLYRVALADSGNELVCEVKAAYRLDRLLPAAPAAGGAQEVERRRLREAAAAAEEAWNRFCAGTTAVLPAFRDQAAGLQQAAEALGHTDCRRLAQAIVGAAHWLAEKPARHSEALAMEIATAILLLQNAQENLARLGSDFARQVDVMVARLHGFLAEQPPEPGTEVPLLDEMSRRAQEKLLVGQVAKEIQSNLAQIEPVLDGFFRDPGRRGDLAALDRPLHQIVGALMMMGQTAAVEALRDCEADIHCFAADSYLADEADFSRLAERLSALGFFVDAMPLGAGDFAAFARALQPAAAAGEGAPATVAPERGAAGDATEASPLAPPDRPAAAGLAPQQAAAPADDDALDSELLAIFIEEAKEVLAAVADQLVELRAQPHNGEGLSHIRRAFHTLKGSGRMVGLRDLGEAAWGLEQALNRWLREDRLPTPPLLALIEQGRDVFSAWVAHLDDRQLPLPDASALAALAESLRTGGELPAAAIAAAGPLTPAAADGRAPEPVPAAAEAAAGLPPAISPALWSIFLEEAGGHLDTLRRELAILAADPARPAAPDMVRAAHTLAGIAGTVGLDDVNRLGVALEHAVRRRETADPLAGPADEVLHQAVAALAAMVAAVAEQRQPAAAAGLVDALGQLYPLPLPAAPAAEVLPFAAAAPAEAVAAVAGAAAPVDAGLAGVADELDEQLLPVFLDEAAGLVETIAENLRHWRADPADAEAARGLSRLFHTLKGSARMAGAMSLGEIAHALESRIEQASRAGGASPESIEEIEGSFDGVSRIVERLQRGESPAMPAAPANAGAGQPPAAGGEAATAVVAAGEAGAAQQAMLRIRADIVDQLVNGAGELAIARSRIEGEMGGLKGSLRDLTESVGRLRRQLRDIEIEAESQLQAHVAQPDEQHAGFDPLEFDRFTRFQELTRMMAESVNDVASVQQNLLRNLDAANAALVAQGRLNRRLQQELMAVRMVPFASQAERLYRIVRQTAKEVGKRVNLEIRGGQVELDRSVLEKIGPPLEHLLRNAVVHGLEGRDARRAAGKAEIGEISLTLAHEGNEIILTLADDGAGLDFARIRHRGIEAGLVAADAAADEGRLIKLIFAPGFTTATSLSQVAGRGIGMDVVKTEIGEIGGRIEVHSLAGKGTTFRLYIPLTLAVTQALLVRAGSQVYALPSSMIEQVLELKEAALAAIRAAGEAAWLGNAYPYRFLPHLLGDHAALPEARRQYRLLLLRSGPQRVAVQVDELQGNREIVVKNIGPQLARVVGISGATVLGDGRVVLILNPVALASRAHALQAPVAAALPVAGAAAASMPTLPTVMVVDDSLTVRKITGRLLARAGYQVLAARDGVDALEQMVDVVPDVLLVDIEMPRMDGFDLTRNVRADDKLKDVPIIMITSRTTDKHRKHAFEIGVNRYLGKPYQEDELMQLVGDYVAAARAR